MLHVGTAYSPVFVVSFTDNDVFELDLFSSQHSDPVCKALSAPGGIIYGFKNSMVRGKCQAELTWREVDLLCKVMEYCSTQPLYMALKKLLKVERTRLTIIEPREFDPRRFAQTSQ